MKEELEKNIVAYIGNNFTVCNDGTLLSSDGTELKANDIEIVARYFYELGRSEK